MGTPPESRGPPGVRVPWVGGTPVLPCDRKMGLKQVEKVKRGVREGGIWPFAGAMAAVPPPRAELG